MQDNSQNPQTPAIEIKPATKPNLVNDHKYANFGWRLLAYIIDVLVLLIPNIIIALIFPTDGALAALNYLLTFLIQAAYFISMESSNRQATVGKLALGMKVTDLEGKQLTPGRAAARYFSKIISSLILGIGYLFCLWTEKKQNLHDIIAKTLVVKKAND